MLQFDPRKRIDVQAALKHPWLAQLHDEAAEPSAPGEPCCCGCIYSQEGWVATGWLLQHSQVAMLCVQRGL
jgi:hypothetical protein